MRRRLREVNVAAFDVALATKAHYVAVELGPDRFWFWPRRELVHIFDAMAKRAITKRWVYFVGDALCFSYWTKGGPRGRFTLRSDVDVIRGPALIDVGEYNVLERTYKPDMYGKRKEGKPRIREAAVVEGAFAR